jgi:hypothetical protein
MGDDMTNETRNELANALHVDVITKNYTIAHIVALIEHSVTIACAGDVSDVDAIIQTIVDDIDNNRIAIGGRNGK